jgi:hypothetical protein
VYLNFTFDDAPGSLAAYDACHRSLVRKIEDEWFLANVPTGAAREEMARDLVSCLEGVGVTGVTPEMSHEEFGGAVMAQAEDDEMVARGLECMGQYTVLFPEG